MESGHPANRSNQAPGSPLPPLVSAAVLEHPQPGCTALGTGRGARAQRFRVESWRREVTQAVGTSAQTLVSQSGPPCSRLSADLGGGTIR